MKPKIHTKKCKTPQKCLKEAKVLAFLHDSGIRSLIPALIELPAGNSTSLKLTRLPGTQLKESELTPPLLYELGVSTKRIHRLGNYFDCGMWNENLTITSPKRKFTDFVKDRISEWHGECKNLAPNPFWNRYVAVLRSQLQKCSGALNRSTAVFCHGDIHPKNILVDSGKLTGLVDWEHAGVFCLEWEMRKFSSFFLDDPGLFDSFLEGYGNILPKEKAGLLARITLLDGIDMLGYLGWCLSNRFSAECQATVARMKVWYSTKKK